MAAWPLSYSVIYQHCLVVLFSPGKFACYRLTDFSRNELLEKQLNTQQFEQHWLFNKQLVGWHNGRAYAYDTLQHAWQRAAQPLPFDKQTKIYEDERFACSMVCAGEFGGLLYFYDKQTGRTHYVEATCGTSVWKQDGRYRVLASLAHMSGSARSGIIAAPETLPEVATPPVAAQSWEYTFANSIPNPAVQRVFAYYGLTMLGGLRWQSQTMYLVSWRDATFLATLADGQMVVVDPLFSSSLGHTGLTTPYGVNLALTALLHYKGRQEREAACLVTNGEQLTKIEWGK
ncbi:hypothetical protein [Hymenobacter properus]|uniref:Uncharacterized protein n=1 Tax=Hymenobacter properus TaxID=2791026 RepID=A0A931BMM7_9BACT|nr:hypothetical protein [Hymenobacter properus]MBF9143058.1 hypothetical protein [Hymenobacter properus]MBR7721866.1 hypothetical protein [Microvirga sp. SRT04]